MESLGSPDNLWFDGRQSWPERRSRSKRAGLVGSLGSERSDSCGALTGTCGRSQRRRPPTRKPCAERRCWDLCGLLEVDIAGDHLLNDSRQAKCHVCHERFPKKALFGKQSGRYVRRDPLFSQFWVCTACVASPHAAPPSMGDTSFSDVKPTVATEVGNLRRTQSTPSLVPSAQTGSKGVCIEVQDDEVPTIPSPTGRVCLARSGAAVVNDMVSEGRRSRPSTPAHNTWVPISCQVCSKSMSTNVDTRAVVAESRVCNACQADRELSGTSSRRPSLPAETRWQARSINGGRCAVAWELVDLAASG